MERRREERREAKSSQREQSRVRAVETDCELVLSTRTLIGALRDIEEVCGSLHSRRAGLECSHALDCFRLISCLTF